MAGWQTVEMPPGGSFTDSVTGRSWNTSNAAPTADFVAVMGYLFTAELIKLEYQPWPYTGAWREPEEGGKLASLSVQRGVLDWWRGSRASQCTIVMDNVTGKDDLQLVPSQKVRVQVEIPLAYPNTFVDTLIEGRIVDRRQTLNASSLPTLSFVVQGDYGYNSKTIIPSSAPTSLQTFVWVQTIATNWFTVIRAPISFGPSNGQQQQIGGADFNAVSALSQLMRGELGMLWEDRFGRMVFRSANWWTPRAPARAVIGDNLNNYSGDYYVPGANVQTLQSLKESISRVTWQTQTPAGSVQTTTGGSVQYGTLFHSDTVFLATTDALALSYATYLRDRKDGFPWERIRRVSFPADGSPDGLQLATYGDVGDRVFVTKEWLPDSGFQVLLSDQVECFIMGVRNTWTPGNGWDCELTVIEGAELPDAVIPT